MNPTNNGNVQLLTVQEGRVLIALGQTSMFITLHFQNNFPSAASDTFIFLRLIRGSNLVCVNLIYDSSY